MSCLCIGGVCIPYSAVLPLLLLGLQWIAAKLARLGLLPEWIGKKLGVSATGTIESKDCCTKETCCPATESTITEATTDTEYELEHVDTLSQWETVFTSSKRSTLIVKFTADWCQPCKKIQPCYSELASTYSKCKFITLDVDGNECDTLSSKMKVAMMPTFVCFKNGVEVGRMNGGNSEERLKEWVGEMCS
eukprot:scaffold24642_cov68-Cyclotella_meneghiniana.AAC.7